jgi:tetratricopeptide (TPR) repeat protein
MRGAFLRAKQGDHDMNSPSVSYFSKTLLSILFVASMVLTPNLVRAQEYSEEEYKAFQDIQAEKDSAKKMDMILNFLKEKPKSALRKNVAVEYQKIIVDLQNEKNWNRIIALGDRFLDVAPNDDFTVSALAAAYSATNNTKGFATFGEKAYASKPSPQLAFAIARAYLSLGNDAKFLQFAERGVAADPDNAEILAEMTRKYLTRQDLPKSVKYAKMCIKALPNSKKPDNVDEQTWKNTVNTQYAAAYYALGASDYQSQNYNGAISNLDQAVKYYKRNDTAYYFLGMSYWQLNKLEPAMLNFAKAYILRGSTSSTAKKYLEQLWANSHRNSLAGIDRVMQRAQQDLK